MASTASKTPLFRTIATRGYAAQAQAAQKAKNADVQTTTLPNKLTVASCESDSPLSRISILFRAGSRNESYDNLGASHVIRNAAGLSTKSSSGFGITRSLQQVGASLTATSDREVLSYTVEITRNQLDEGLKQLQAACTNQIFKPWEIEDSLPRIRATAIVSYQARAIELAHKAAYRNGLGNSIFIPKYQIGKLTSETLQHYFSSNFTTNRAAIVGVGVDHQVLVGFAQCLPLESGPGKDIASTFTGGAEVRKDKGGKLAHVAVVTQGAPLKNLKEAIAFSVLQAAAGIEPATKRGDGQGPLLQAINKSSSGQIASSALNVSYSDNGLFGFIVSCDGKDAGKAVEAGVAALKSRNISQDAITRGKAQLKAAVLFKAESGCGLNEILGEQAVLLGNVLSVGQIVAEIDAISASDVSNAASKVGSGKFSIGAVGNLENVPYANQIN